MNCETQRKDIQQVHSDNDASWLDILGHFATFWDILGHSKYILGQFGTYWDNSEDFLTNLEHLDCFPSP